MLKNINQHKVLFIDIETVPEAEFWDDISPELQELWANKTAYRREKEEIAAEDFYKNNAGIWAEFGKIVCISVGFITKFDKIRVKSFFGHNEKTLLGEFADLLNQHYYSSQSLLCGHNIKEFDIPFLARRMLINQIELPNVLNLFGKKPWEVPHLDTMELWKFGDYKHFTSLSLLANILNIPTPKDDINGSLVAEVYYKEKNLDRIRIYCEKDVIAVAQIFRKLRFESMLELDETSDEY